MNHVRRRGVAILLLAALAVASGCSKSGGAPGAVDQPRVMVLGIDGGTWSEIVPMIEAGELPTLARLYNSGIHGVLRSRPPALSPVVWSTIFTGKLPAEHGVVDWKTSQSRHRKVKALWEMTSEQGLATDVFNVPSTYPPIPIAGVMISGFPLGGATLGGNTGVVSTSAGFTDKVMTPYVQFAAPQIRAAIAGLAVGDWTPWFEVKLRNRPTWRAAMRVKRLGADKYYLSPIYRTDGQFVISDPPDTLARLGPVLEARPYVPEGPGWSKHAEPDTPDYLFEHLVHVARIQTDAVAAFASEDWRLFVYVDTLVDRTSHPYWAYSHPEGYDGLSLEKAARYANVVKDSYREVDRQLAEVLDSVKGDDTYVMLASDHGFTTSADKKLYIGTHHLDGIYLVAGPGIEKLAAEKANIEDITPTALYLLGLPVGDDMAGKVIPEVKQALNRRVASIPTYEADVATVRGSDKPVDKETWDQLKGLGYVD